MSEKTVFISYRRDATGKSFARSIKEALTHHGYDVFLDVDCTDAGKWAMQIRTQVPKRAHFLLLLTPGSLDRCANESDWVRKEYELAVASERNIVPVREESVDLTTLPDACPKFMRSIFDHQIATIQHSGFANDIAKLIERYISKFKAPKSPEPASKPSTPRPIPVDISRIIKYAPAVLMGREKEMQLLNAAWDKVRRAETKRAHVLTFVALGGEGKTSLIAKWAAELANENWPGCDGVFAWSFYSQGSHEQTAASADLFLNEALTFFGDAATANSSQGAYDKGKRLAQLVGERRALLLLDGLEPLQYAPTSPTPGELRDQGLAALLKSLATQSLGLCIVTTRSEIPDLRAFNGKTVHEETLVRLSLLAGIALLHSLGVQGSLRKNILSPDGTTLWNEFEKLVEDVQGHALTLNLMGSFLTRAFQGDIRKRDRVKFEKADAKMQNGRAFRALAAYEEWLLSGGDEGEREVAILRLLGLFDRPADAGCLRALRSKPIPHLTEPIFQLPDDDWEFSLSGLESAKLLTVNRMKGSGELISLDAHPLLREYFAKQLREKLPHEWRAAHQLLYEHLYNTTKILLQPTLEQLQPLYQAIAHGCHANLHRIVRAKVYRDRIHQSREFYSTRTLGAYGSDLGAAACFFDSPWSTVSSILEEDDQEWLLYQAAICLRAVGRLTEALQPMLAAQEMAIRRKKWSNAAAYSSHLSQVELTLGNVARAIEYGETSMNFAEHDSMIIRRIQTRTSFANAISQAGRRAEAESHFKKAEQAKADYDSLDNMLNATSGFLYCDLLLAHAEFAAWKGEFRNQQPKFLSLCKSVSIRAKQTLKSATRNNWLLDIALDHLTLAKCSLFEAIQSVRKTNFSLANHEIEIAMSNLRKAGQIEYIPRGLLTRAWIRKCAGQLRGLDSAESDLNEAWEIAEPGSMRLHMADIYLYRARLFFSEEKYPWDSAKADLDAAEKLINECGYHRRDAELADAREVIGKS